MSKYKLSIIVPVYNVVDYFDECMNSLLNQDCNSYEIIIIDDGSTDGSALLCNKYIDYNNIKVIHQINKGTSEARNLGIMEAQGEYILFVDSDDYISTNILSKLLNQIYLSTPDVVFLIALKVFPDGTTKLVDEVINRSYIKNKSQQDVINYLATLKKYPGSACTKLVRKNFIIENKIYFPPGKYYEDLYWTLQILLHASKFDYFDEVYYYYRQKRHNSITSSITEDKFIDSCSLIPYATSLSSSLENTKSINAINSFMGYHLGILIYQIGFLPREVQLKYYKFIKDYKYLLSYRNDFKTFCARNLLNLFGIRLTSRLATLYYRIKNM